MIGNVNLNIFDDWLWNLILNNLPWLLHAANGRLVSPNIFIRYLLIFVVIWMPWNVWVPKITCQRSKMFWGQELKPLELLRHISHSKISTLSKFIFIYIYIYIYIYMYIYTVPLTWNLTLSNECVSSSSEYRASAIDKHSSIEWESCGYRGAF